MVKDILNRYDEGIVFYGSAACGRYSNAYVYEGLVFTKEEFETLERDNHDLLPSTNTTFYELDGKHSEVDGYAFKKEFDSLAEYYLWYQNNTVYMDSPVEEMMDLGGIDWLQTSDVLHKVVEWKNRDQSLVDIISREYSVIQKLVRKGGN